MQIPAPGGHPRAPNPAGSRGPPRVPNPNMLVESPSRAPQPGHFDNTYSGSPSRPSPTPSVTAAPKPAEPRKSQLAFLLNNDEPTPPTPAAPKRVDEVARGTMSVTSSPPPQRGAPPPSGPQSHMRREEGPVGFSPYGRTPGPPGMPSLKPYNTPHNQSPIAQHSGITRSSMVSPVEAVERERDFYAARQSYGSQHQMQPSGSPHQSHHYDSPNQPPSMVYQSQPQPTSYPGYGPPGGSQSHAPSPTIQYSHPSRSREPTRESLFRDSVPPPNREMQWPPPQGPPQSASSRMPPDSWPAPKATPAPQPAASPWGSQHGSATKLMRETPQPQWSSAPPSHLNMRDERDLREREVRQERYSGMGLRGPSPAPTRADERAFVLESQRPPPEVRMGEQRMDARDPRFQGHPHHQHSHSGSLGRMVYNPSPVPSREHLSGPPSGPPQSQNPAYGQRYSTPGPPRGDVPPVPRSYTPISAQQQHQHYEMQLRDREMREREMREREIREREMREREMRDRDREHQRQLQLRAMDDDMHRRELAAQDLSRMRGGGPPPQQLPPQSAEEQQQQHHHHQQQQQQQQQQYGRPPQDYGRGGFQGELRGGAPPPPPPQQQQQPLLGLPPGSVQELRIRPPPPEGYPPPRDARDPRDPRY